MSSWYSFEALQLCHAENVLGFLGPKGNYNNTAYKDILYSCLFPMMWHDVVAPLVREGHVSTDFWLYGVFKYKEQQRQELS